MNNDRQPPRIQPWTPATRFLGWRRRDVPALGRACSRTVSKREALGRARLRIPADHPDIPF